MHKKDIEGIEALFKFYPEKIDIRGLIVQMLKEINELQSKLGVIPLSLVEENSKTPPENKVILPEDTL